jgi:integrase
VQVKPSTRNGYESIVRSAIIPTWGATPLAGLTHAGIQKWLAEESKRVAPSTTRSYHRVLSIMLKYAARDGRLTRNPADGVKLPRIVSRKHGYLTHSQVHQFAELCGADGDVILFLSYTGLRWGEMAALRVMDLDVLPRRVNVDQAVTEVGYTLVYGTPKNHSHCSVPFPFLPGGVPRRPLSGQETERLRLHLARGRPDPEQELASPSVRASDGEDARAASRSRPACATRPAAHRCIPRAISAGANVKAVQKMLGHTSAAMTLDVYADLFDDDLDAVGDALSAAGDPAALGKANKNATSRVTTLPR